jgi:hypothetical protein
MNFLILTRTYENMIAADCSFDKGGEAAIFGT